MNKTAVTTLAAGLAIGGLAGVFFTPQTIEVKSAAVSESASVKRGPIEDLGAAASNEALRVRIAELEAELATLTQKNSEIEVEGPSRREGRRGGRGRFGGPGGPGGDPREWMAKMEKEDPERFQQMTNRFAQMRRRHEEDRARKFDYLQSLDTSAMNASARSTHRKLLDNTEAIAELEAKLRDPNLTEEERRSCFEDLRSLHESQRQLNQSERENLIAQYAEDAGLDPDSAALLKDSVMDVFEATSGGRGGPGGMPPPPPPPPMM